ncbi:hypothetical protein BD626DRAFT_472703 [Schizophyllum amplum]|uniref:SnoaL-like domain-containing protein n=1 Tax=Schizophyllum amplum TaxID=97359 RepID=A0A550CW66_9AGAR|nr:hypothetical protein BD626DRAFT_472703 [Auriculariopsis ampla]
MAPDPNSPRYRLVLAFFRAFSASDVETMISLFADPFEYRLLPKASGRPIITNKSHLRTYFSGIRNEFREYNIEIQKALDCDEDVMFVHVRESDQWCATPMIDA